VEWDKMGSNMILGLDLSSTCIGWCILSDNGSVEHIHYLDLKKLDDLYAKADYFSAFLRETKEKYAIDKVFIEEPVQVYSTSTAKIISLLQRWNGMASLCIYNTMGIQPFLISSHAARKAVGIKVPRGVKTKQYVYDCLKVLNVIPENVFEYKKTGTPKESNFDICDAYVVAKAGYLLSKTLDTP